MTDAAFNHAPAARLGGGAAPRPARDVSGTTGNSLDVFALALLDADTAEPGDVQGRDGAPAGRRFDVYRNNVVVSLKEALAQGFPVVEKLVGAEFFAAMAGVFVRAHPPASPVMSEYGAEFPGFLEGFPPVAGLPYLADVARLELTVRAAGHAADSRPIRPEALQHPALAEARLGLAPALRVVTSPYPIHAIWRANMQADAPPVRGGAQNVLVTRPDWDVRLDSISDDDAGFLHLLSVGQTLGAALEIAPEGFDLGTLLALLLDTKSIVSIEVPA